VTAVCQVQRPRVLHVIQSLAVGGMEQRLLGLIEHSTDRFEHRICCIRDPRTDAPRFEAAGAQTMFVGKSAGRDRGVLWRIARVCRSLRPQIVHTRNWGSIEGVLAARLARVPVVIHGEHGRDHATYSTQDRRRDQLRRLLFPLIDRIVVVSKPLERWLLDEMGVVAHKAAFIPNGVDTERFRPNAERDRLRQERGYGPHEMLIGAVGRIQSVKNYPALIAAFEQVLRSHPEVRLVIVGDGPERAALDDDIRRRRLSRTARLAGHQEDVHDWLAAMDLFVHPSLMEGTSNAILEAMSVGVPVVATSVGGNPEVVQNGITGRLVNAADVAALVEAILLYVHTPALRHDHGRAGRASVMKRYPLARMVRAYQALYDEALDHRRSRIAAPVKDATL